MRERRDMTIAFLSVAWLALTAPAAVPTPERPLPGFGQFSVANPNMRAEVRLATGVTLAGEGGLWTKVTGLSQRVGVRCRDKAALVRVLGSLRVRGRGLPWDGHTGSNAIRVYFDNDKIGEDLVWYFYRKHRAYCVPELYHWSARRYRPQRGMFLVGRSSSRHFEALLGSISRRAQRPGSGFSLVNFGGD